MPGIALQAAPLVGMHRPVQPEPSLKDMLDARDARIASEGPSSPPLSLQPGSAAHQGPPPMFTPRVPQCHASSEPPPHSARPQSKRLSVGRTCGGSVLSTDLPMATASHLSTPLPVGPVMQEPNMSPQNTSAAEAVSSGCEDEVPCEPAASGSIVESIDERCHVELESPTQLDADVEEIMNDVVEEAEDRLAGLMTRSNSESSLQGGDEGEPSSGEEELDHFVPSHCTQSMEWPLSKNEKREYYTKLCDQERTAAVLQYKQLKRHTLSMARTSMAGTCKGNASDHDSLDGSEHCENDDDHELLLKQRELERQLQEVRTHAASYRNRVSLSHALHRGGACVTIAVPPGPRCTCADA